MRRRVQSVSDG